MSKGWYLLIRLILWVVVVGLALLPTLRAIDDHSWNLFKSANDARLFRDLFFAVVPVTALALSTLLDFLCTRYAKLSGTAFALSIIALIFNVAGLATGLVGFVTIAADAILGPVPLWTYSALICMAVVCSLATEIGVSYNHKV